uniref:CSON010773 protein n=1 Tax=Culicoides sonorensis TaxID=179676 RepID=A0A336M2H6_CULSO
MKKRKSKDSKMILISSNKWLCGHKYLLKSFILILISSIFVVNVSGSNEEKPLIIENYTLEPSSSSMVSPLKNNTNVNHQTVVEITTISNYDSMEDEDLSSEMIQETGTKITDNEKTTTETPKLDSTNIVKSSVLPTSQKLQMTQSSVEKIQTATKAPNSTPLRQRSYDISLNKTNDIESALNVRAFKSTSDNMLNGADVLAFANIEDHQSSSSTTPRLQENNVTVASANNTLKSLMDWTHILKTMETSTENENEITSMLMMNESRTDIIPKMSTKPIIMSSSSSTTNQMPTFMSTEAPITKSTPVPLTTTSTSTERIRSTYTERPTFSITKNLLPIGEVYRKKYESMATQKPSSRIDVNEYYRTETAPYLTSTKSYTDEPDMTTTTWHTTIFDKRNTEMESETTTDAPLTSTTIFKRQNYRFTTESPISTIQEFISTITPMTSETTTFNNLIEKETTTTEVPETTTTTSSMPTTTTTPQISTQMTSTVSSTKNIITSTTEAVTKIPKTFSNIITTQTIATDNDNIWVVNEETTPITTVSTSSSTVSEEIGSTEAPGNDVMPIVVISLSVVGVVAFLLLMAFLFIIRKRQNQTKYANRCRPVGLDAYSLDNVSVYNSVRRKANNLRLSKRSYGNPGFDDPNLQSHVLTVPDLATFVQNKYAIYDEYKDIPVITSRIEEMPFGCEDKNRYSNVIPLPETRVHLQRQNDDEKTEYINANYVKGPQDTTNYYIATQAPLDNTIHDFWRMVWEQQCKVIIMATDLSENGIEKCAQYLPSSVVLDNVQTYGNYQITLKSREVKEKYALSTIHIKHLETKSFREIVHFWYSWPETGIPSDETSLIAMLLEARSYSRLSLPEQRISDNELEISSNNNNRDIESGVVETNGKTATSTFDKTRSLQRTQTPIIVHCSPGTSRTGTIIACDIVLRTLEIPPRKIDIPKIVYTVRRGRANAVQTKQQYEFIYKVAHVYATKLNGPSID